MTRDYQPALLIGAAALAAFGVSLVNFAGQGTVDAEVGLTFLTVLIAFGGVYVATRRFASEAITLLLPPIAVITGFGFVEIYRLNPFRAGLQRWWLMIGAALAVVVLAWVSRNGLASLRRYRNVLLVLAVLLLLMPLLPASGPLPVKGLTVNGSRLWIVIDLFFIELNFQPGEVAKLLFVVFLASYLADRQPALTGAHRQIGRFRMPEPRQLGPLLLVWVGSLGILVAQRDLGASLLLFLVFVATLYVATGEGGYLVGGTALILIGGFASWRMFDHVQRRVSAWIDPFGSFEDAGYQVAQGIFGLGTGSLAGSGPGLGQPELIPNAITDFVFAAVGEEFGFAGSVAVLGCYALLVAVGLGIALRARDRFRKLLAFGLTFVLALQVFLIIGGVLRVVPLTGIALPFMSYGGSSMVGNFILVALLLSISHEEASA